MAFMLALGFLLSSILVFAGAILGALGVVGLDLLSVRSPAAPWRAAVHRRYDR